MIRSTQRVRIVRWTLGGMSLATTLWLTAEWGELALPGYSPLSSGLRLFLIGASTLTLGLAFRGRGPIRDPVTTVIAWFGVFLVGVGALLVASLVASLVLLVVLIALAFDGIG